MMPTIRVDDDVFAGLQSLASPFVDTPNSVIRRLLEERDVVPRQREPETTKSPGRDAVGRESLDRKSERVELTPQPVYETFLLHVLANEFNGRGDKHDVTKAVLKLMRSHGFLGTADFQDVSSGESRAENTIAWGRNALKERGQISRNSARGVWELTPVGMRDGKSVALPRKSQ